MKVIASLNNLRIAPRKVRLVAGSIVGMRVDAALVELTKQTKRSSGPMHTLLRSAIANAENNFKMNRESLVVSSALVGEGPRLKRWMPRAFGRAAQIMKRTSKINIVLEERAGIEEKKKEGVSTKKKVTKKKD